MYFPPPWGEGGEVYFIILSSHHLLHGHYLFPCQVLHFLCTSSERFAQNCLIFPVSFLGDLCLPAQSPCFWLDCPPLGSDHLLSLKVFRPLCLLCLYTLALPGLTHQPCLGEAQRFALLSPGSDQDDPWELWVWCRALVKELPGSVSFLIYQAHSGLFLLWSILTGNLVRFRVIMDVIFGYATEG